MNVFNDTVLPTTTHYTAKLNSDLLALLLKWHREKLVAFWEEKLLL